MRRVDEVAVQEFGIDLLQMMENAGRNLARHAMDMLGSESSKAPILIAAGAGGNGGGGLCCARHLHNRGCSVVILLDRDPDLFQGVPKRQLHILETAGIKPISLERGEELFQSAGLLIDALIGYSLRGAPRDVASRLIEGMCRKAEIRFFLSIYPLERMPPPGRSPDRLSDLPEPSPWLFPRRGSPRHRETFTSPISVCLRSSFVMWASPFHRYFGIMTPSSSSEIEIQYSCAALRRSFKDHNFRLFPINSAGAKDG